MSLPSPTLVAAKQQAILLCRNDNNNKEEVDTITVLSDAPTIKTSNTIRVRGCGVGALTAEEEEEEGKKKTVSKNLVVESEEKQKRFSNNLSSAIELVRTLMKASTNNDDDDKDDERCESRRRKKWREHLPWILRNIMKPRAQNLRWVETLQKCLDGVPEVDVFDYQALEGVYLVLDDDEKTELESFIQTFLCPASRKNNSGGDRGEEDFKLVGWTYTSHGTVHNLWVQQTQPSEQY